MSYIIAMFPDNRIRELRKKAGLTQAELGAMVGLHQTQIANLENGERNLTFDWGRRIAKAMGLNFADLLLDEDNPERLRNGEERELVSNFREATGDQQEMIARVAAPIRRFTPAPPEEERRSA